MSQSRVVVDLRRLDDSPLQRLRVLLTADVLRRVVEDLLGGQALVGLLVDRFDSVAGWAASAYDLQIRDPTTAAITPDEIAAQLRGTPCAVVEPSGLAEHVEQVVTTTRIPVAGVTRSERAGPADGGDFLDEYDALELRLALLRVRHSERVALSKARLRRAEETLHRWRVKVAGWAEMPSAPAHPECTTAIREALVSGLDTARVLTLLHRLEVDPRSSSGSKFETFVLADRVLALDLGHLVGKLPR